MSRLIIEVPECECYRPKSAAKQLACYRTSYVTDAKAAHEQLHKIQRDMVRTRRLLMVDGQRSLTEFLQGFFERRIELFCHLLTQKVNFGSSLSKSWSVKDANDVITLQSTEQMWRETLMEALGVAADHELMTEYTPIVQSIAARAYDRTTTFLGEQPAPDSNLTIFRRSQEMARLVTRINETTREQLVEVLEKAVEEHQTVAEAVRTIRESVPQIESSRIPTIARTEIGNAVDAGTKQALFDSAVVRTVKVIGCKAREKNSPQYNGQSTCNITGVPVRDVNKLIFHPNHTGAIVVESFVDD